MPREGQSSAINKTQVLAEEQTMFTIEMVIESPQGNEIVEDQTNILKRTTSFLEIPREETIVSLEEVEKKKVQTKILTPIYPFKTRDNSLINPFFTNQIVR